MAYSKSMSDNYVWSLPYLPLTFNSIVEVGSRDALDAIFLSEFFDCEVVSFEPNPLQIEVCKENIVKSGRSSIKLRTEALSNENATIDFFVVDTTLYDNSGASGLFLIDFSNRPKNDPDRGHAPIQIPVRVKALRWDSLGLSTPELLVMDCEGAELAVLEGFGEEIKKVRFIVLEVNQVAIGEGACTFKQIDKFLRKSNFEFVASRNFMDRYYYLKIRLFASSFKKRIRKPFGKTQRGLLFDVVYRNARE